MLHLRAVARQRTRIASSDLATFTVYLNNPSLLCASSLLFAARFGARGKKSNCSI